MLQMLLVWPIFRGFTPGEGLGSLAADNYSA
jgi:hypothetical protein